MKTACPRCNQEYDVEDRFRDATVQCSECGQEFVVAPAGPIPASPKPAPAINHTSHPAWGAFFLNILTGIVLVIIGGGLLVLSLVFSLNPDSLPASSSVAGFVIIGIPLVLVGIWILFSPTITIRATSFSIKDGKLICKSGLLSLSETSCSLADIRNVTVTQSIAERILGLGTLEISSAATTQNATLRVWGIKDFREFANLLESSHK